MTFTILTRQLTAVDGWQLVYKLSLWPCVSCSFSFSAPGQGLRFSELKYSTWPKSAIREGLSGLSQPRSAGSSMSKVSASSAVHVNSSVTIGIEFLRIYFFLRLSSISLIFTDPSSFRIFSFLAFSFRILNFLSSSMAGVVCQSSKL